MNEHNNFIKDFIREFIDNVIKYSKDSKDISNKIQKKDPSEEEFIKNSKKILKQIENDKEEFAQFLLIEINKLQRIDYYRISKMFSGNTKKSKFREIISLALNGNLEKVKRKKISDKLAGNSIVGLDIESQFTDLEQDNDNLNNKSNYSN